MSTKKNIVGPLLILTMTVAVIGMAVYFYQVLRHRPEYQEQASRAMHDRLLAALTAESVQQGKDPKTFEVPPMAGDQATKAWRFTLTQELWRVRVEGDHLYLQVPAPFKVTGEGEKLDSSDASWVQPLKTLIIKALALSEKPEDRELIFIQSTPMPKAAAQ